MPSPSIFRPTARPVAVFSRNAVPDEALAPPLYRLNANALPPCGSVKVPEICLADAMYLCPSYKLRVGVHALTSVDEFVLDPAPFNLIVAALLIAPPVTSTT